MTGDSSAETTRPEGMVFPCEVEVKVFGKSAAGFEQLVKAVIESVVLLPGCCKYVAGKAAKANINP